MKFYSLGEASVKIILDGSDMEKYGVRYETMDYGSTHTKRVIWDILDAAKAETGFDAKGGKLHIQVYPLYKGGCEMYISRMPQYGVASDKKNKVFAFAGIDEAIDAAVMLCASDCVLQSVLYECDGKWYISSADSDMLSEYGFELSGALWEPYLSEHGKVVAKGNELEKLARAFVRE